VIDSDARKVYVNGQDAELSYKEYELLLYFVKNEGIALTRDKIIENVWSDFDGFDRTVDAHVKSLRKKLGDFSERIQTVRGVGYRFENEKD
jgi:DNA-binding response OmpR family regulator